VLAGSVGRSGSRAVTSIVKGAANGIELKLSYSESGL
jgi:hypothetical protein